MSNNPLRSIGTQVVSATAGAVIAVVLVGSGLAFAQEAPETGAGVAEVAAANSVDSAAIINGSVTGGDIANATIGRQDIKPNVVARWAKVNAGIGVKLLRGRGVESAFRGGVGVYRVVFSDPIDTCGWSATLNDNSTGTALPGQITVESAVGTPTDLIVRTFSPTGVAADTQETDGFTVAVDC